MSFDTNTITVEHLKETLSITKVGVFIWNLETDHVIYSKEWAEIVGYELEELESHVSTWESMLLPEDLKIAEQSVEKYLSGEAPLYEAEFRMVKKDGSVIWGHDKGKVTKYTEDGKPLILCGVLQDITNIKLTEQLLRESTDILNLAIEVAEFGTWDWDIVQDKISYNDEYLFMLGYTQEEIDGSLAEWEAMNHPEDLVIVTKMLDEFVAGKIKKYECEIRMRHKDGHYVWTKDVGQIASKDENGIATRVIGGHLNIDSLKRSQSQLEETLAELEKHQEHLENEIELRTKSLTEQDKLLFAVNAVSQNLLAVDESDDFDSILIESLKSLTYAYNTSEFTLWRYKKIENSEFFYLTHLYRKEFDEKIIFNVGDIDQYIINLLKQEEEFYIHTREDNNVIVHYSKVPEEMRQIFESEITVRDLMSGLNELWNDDVKNKIENNESSIVSPIFLYNELFGIIATGSTSEDIIYSEAHESMLNISGKLFANAQNKHEMDEQLRSAHEEALLSSQAKSNFLANMSHEIRTPLNAILGMSEIVLRESKGRASEEYATEIKKASENLLLIINDILDISKIESGKLEIIEVDYTMSSLLHDIIGISKMRIEDKPILLTTFIQSDMPNMFFGDEMRIKQILINLTSNAIKFTKTGNIDLSVQCEKNDDEAVLVLRVSDTGIGIKDDDMQRLFMQFERVDTKRNRNIEGTGLGLAITKQLCEMMNGSISVESEDGVGSVFTVRIPQKYRDDSSIAQKADNIKILIYEAREVYANSFMQTFDDLHTKSMLCTNQSELTQALLEQEYDYLLAPAVYMDKIKSLCLQLKVDLDLIFTTDPGDLNFYSEENIVNLPINCIQLGQIFGNADLDIRDEEKVYSFIAPSAKILVVDDNRINLEVAKGLMKPFDMSIETAMNGRIALEMVQENIYDLVFMDHMMPEMDGIDATVAIRKLEGDYYQQLPIIALTANALVGAKELFVKEGMNDFLAKPIEVEKLHEILQKWLPKEKQACVIIQEKSVKEHNISIEGLDTNYGLSMIGGELRDYNDVLNAFFIDGLHKIEKISSIDLEKDLDNYRIEIHALKSAAASIGAKDISHEAKLLEEAAMKQDFNYLSMNAKEFISQFSKVLYAIRGYLSQQNQESKEGRAEGDTALLLANFKKIEEALSTLDIDLFEEALESCKDYTWRGSIEDILNNINELVEAFEYYNARPLVQDLKNEILAQYKELEF